jgi:putative hydrolase of the HAD superfamily
MSELKAVIFDLDDTLVPEMEPERDALLVVCGLAEAKYGANPTQMLKTIDESCQRLWAQWETPIVYSEISYSVWEGLWGPSDSLGSDMGNDPETIGRYKRETWDEVLAAHGIQDVTLRDEIIERHRAERVKRLVPYSGVPEVLEQVKEQFPLAIVTNGSPAVQRFKLNESGLTDYFEVVVASGDIGIGKPRPEPFMAALDQLGVEASEAVMIGNSWSSDIQGAANLGMPSIWFNAEGLPRPDRGSSPDAEIGSVSEILGAIDSLLDRR